MPVGLLILSLGVCSTFAGSPCLPRDFGHSSHVCVCNSEYCDEYDEVIPKAGEIQQFVSDRPEGQRLEKYSLAWNNDTSTVGVVISIDRNIKYQQIIGFGGAFTDAAGINIAKLSVEAQRKLIKSYYSPSGAEYNLGRIPIGGCDFSDRPYTYCDTEGDVDLVSFNLTHDDHLFKIPYIQMAKEMSGKEILLYGSPWSAPAWMKSNNALNGQGYLLPEYYQTWADYYVKFIEAYKEEGISMWGLTAQNEALVAGNAPNFAWNCMGWNASSQATWIGQNLGPSLGAAGFEDIMIMAFDDQRPLLYGWADGIMEDVDAAKYVDGWAVHWYVDFLGGPGVLDSVHEKYPEKFILFSEACTGSYPWDLQKVLLGSWERGQEYINDIITNLNHWSTGWTDWNLVLDMNGGPNWANNEVDAPIIVNQETDEFYKQPMYYGLAHFGKFLPEGSYRIKHEMEGFDSDRIQSVAFERPDGALVLIVTNQHMDQNVRIRIAVEGGGSEVISIGPQSVHSFLWM